MKKLYSKVLNILKCEDSAGKGLPTRAAISTIIMLLCVVVLCSTTLAYFSDTVLSGSGTIGSATYSLTITDGDGDTVSDTYICRGNSDYVYTFTLTATGTASTGYCKVTADGEVYFTDQIERGTQFTLKFKAADETVITFEPIWGTPSASVKGTTHGDGTLIECANAQGLTYTPVEEDEYILHTVVEGETLEDIAALYNVAVEAICKHNNISVDTELIVGQQIAIPKDAIGEITDELTTETSVPSTETTASTTETASTGEISASTTETTSMTETTTSATKTASTAETSASTTETTSMTETAESTTETISTTEISASTSGTVTSTTEES